MKCAIAGVGLIASCVALAAQPNLAAAPRRFLLLYAVAFACYAAGAWLLRDARGARACVLVLGVALVARLALFPAAPSLSTDAYRYVWDARVARAGFSPYAFAPNAPELEALRDAEIYPRLNHPTWRTVYPPGAQVFFQAVYALAPDSVMAMKTALGLFELLGLGALLGLLRASGIPAPRVILYAWNPLVLVEIWGSGHLDALVVPSVVAVAWAAMANRPALAGALLAGGALVKLYPAALLPLLAGVGGLRVAAVFAAIVLAAYAAAGREGIESLFALGRYIQEEYFNPGLLRSLIDSHALVLSGLVAWIAWSSARTPNAPLPERMVPLIGGVIVLGANVFPWYALWLVPMLAVAPSPAWIAFTGMVALAYTFFLTDAWSIPWWARAAQVVPLVAVALGWLRPRRALPSGEEAAT